MPNRTVLLVFLSSVFVLSASVQSAQAGTLTSVFVLNANGRVGTEALDDHDVTGGTITVRYPALGTRTPDLGGGNATLLSGSILLTDGKFIFLDVPKQISIQSGGVGSVRFEYDYVYLTGTLAGYDVRSDTYVSFSINATLPPIASLPAISNFSLRSFSGFGYLLTGSLGYFYSSGGPLPGNEISRTFDGGVPVPMFAAGPALAAATLLLTGLFAVARRSRRLD